MIDSVNLFTDSGMVRVVVARSERWDWCDDDGTEGWMLWGYDGVPLRVHLVDWLPGVVVDVATLH
jgi:hypothetical protein